MNRRNRDELFGIPNQLVMDPVHGGIPFFEHEKLVFNHPLFQRLRWIVQNDITSMVFPGATHTRFQHSLGAMHVAGRLWKSMVRGYLSDPKITRDSAITGEQQESIRYFYFCIRLAALLHDTGHFPFSHQLEASAAVKTILHRAGLFEKLWDGIEWKAIYKAIPGHLYHEHYSVRCAYQMLKESLGDEPEVDLVDVIALMETSACQPSARFQTAAWHALTLLVRTPAALNGLSKDEVSETFQKFFQTIISGELDVDKMDYLLRDSFFSGCHYGVYNLDHLLSTIRIGFNSPGTKTWVGLAVTDKGIVPLEDFVYARFQLYQDLYSHKAVVGFKWLLARAVDELVAHDVEARRFTESALSEISDFKDFTDTFLWERLRSYGRANPNSAAGHLLSRRKLDFIVTKMEMASFEKEKLVSDLKRKYRRNVVYNESPIKFSKMSKPYDKIRVLHYDPLEDSRSLEAIRRHSAFFEKFHDVVITHFYFEPEFAKSKREESRKRTARKVKISN